MNKYGNYTSARFNFNRDDHKFDETDLKIISPFMIFRGRLLCYSNKVLLKSVDTHDLEII